MRFVLGKRGAEYVGGLAPEMAHLAKLFDEGTDWVLRRPPVLIVFHADSAGGTFAGVNATLAVQNATLAAESMGLDYFFTNFLILASEREKKIGEILHLSPHHGVYGALGMGHPKLKFRNWPERKPARVTWL